MPTSATAAVPPSSARAIENLIATYAELVDTDDQAGTATARSYVTVFQARPGLTLQPIMSGRYHDRFQRRDGCWRFTERRVLIDLTGDLTGHLRQAGPTGP
jgi:hypothetical protein